VFQLADFVTQDVLHYFRTRGHIEISLGVNYRAEIVVKGILEKRRSWAKLRGIGAGIRPCVSIKKCLERVGWYGFAHSHYVRRIGCENIVSCRYRPSHKHEGAQTFVYRIQNGAGTRVPAMADISDPFRIHVRARQKQVNAATQSDG